MVDYQRRQSTAMQCVQKEKTCLQLPAAAGTGALKRPPRH